MIHTAHITAKVSTILFPIYRDPESKCRDQIRCSPDLWPFRYPGSCLSLPGDKPVAFDKTTLSGPATYLTTVLGQGFPSSKWESKENAEWQRREWRKKKKLDIVKIRKRKWRGEGGLSWEMSSVAVETIRESNRRMIPSWSYFMCTDSSLQ